MNLALPRAFAVATVALASGAASAQILNGSFERPRVPPGNFSTFSEDGPAVIPGWTVVSGSVDVIGNGLWSNRSAASGVRMLDLNGASAGWIQQSFATVAGLTYNISYKIWSNPDSSSDVWGSSTGERTGSSFITANGYLNPQIVSQSFSSAIDAAGWASYSYSVVGTGSKLYLNFKGVDYGPYGALLDSVSVTAVPEPGTYALMLAGLGVLGFTARRRKASAAGGILAGA